MCCEWHALSLVVVNDLYVVGVALPEDKANTPTCVYRHRPLAFAVSLELVQPDALERADVIQSFGRIQDGQQFQRRVGIETAKSGLAGLE